MSKVMLLSLASALDITATGAQAAKLLNVTPFVGGRGRSAILSLAGAVGGSGVVKIQGASTDIHTTPGTSDWSDIVSLTSASPLTQEIELPQWIRVNVTTAGTGTVTINCEGVQ